MLNHGLTTTSLRDFTITAQVNHGRIVFVADQTIFEATNNFNGSLSYANNFNTPHYTFASYRLATISSLEGLNRTEVQINQPLEGWFAHGDMLNIVIQQDICVIEVRDMYHNVLETFDY